MRFLEIILENSKLKEAKLLSAAKKASNNPEIGITIQNKAAYYVIKDCATIASHYLPHYIFGGYADPFQELSGKFTRVDIQQFVKESETNSILKQLLDIILSKAGTRTQNTEQTNSHLQNIEFETLNPYGDYGCYESNESNQNIKQKNVVDILCELFTSK